jgi:hypothetical protein
VSTRQWLANWKRAVFASSAEAIMERPRGQIKPKHGASAGKHDSF